MGNVEGITVGIVGIDDGMPGTQAGGVQGGWVLDEGAAVDEGFGAPVVAGAGFCAVVVVVGGGVGVGATGVGLAGLAPVDWGWGEAGVDVGSVTGFEVALSSSEGDRVTRNATVPIAPSAKAAAPTMSGVFDPRARGRSARTA